MFHIPGGVPDRWNCFCSSLCIDEITRILSYTKTFIYSCYILSIILIILNQKNIIKIVPLYFSKWQKLYVCIMEVARCIKPSMCIHLHSLHHHPYTSLYSFFMSHFIPVTRHSIWGNLIIEVCLLASLFIIYRTKLSFYNANHILIVWFFPSTQMIQISPSYRFWIKKSSSTLYHGVHKIEVWVTEKFPKVMNLLQTQCYLSCRCAKHANVKRWN